MKYLTDLYQSPAGDLRILYKNNDLSGLYFEEYFNTRFRKLDYNRSSIESPISLETKRWLDKYFNYQNPDPMSLSIKPEITPFQKEVYKILMKQPFGTTTTYGDLRDQFEFIHNRRMSAQAIGGAMKRNPIVIVIPCHRVLKRDNGTDNFACGIEHKKFLLDFERNYNGN